MTKPAPRRPRSGWWAGSGWCWQCGWCGGAVYGVGRVRVQTWPQVGQTIQVFAVAGAAGAAVVPVGAGGAGGERGVEAGPEHGGQGGGPSGGGEQFASGAPGPGVPGGAGDDAGCRRRARARRRGSRRRRRWAGPGRVPTTTIRRSSTVAAGRIHTSASRRVRSCTISPGAVMAWSRSWHQALGQAGPGPARCGRRPATTSGGGGGPSGAGPR